LVFFVKREYDYAIRICAYLAGNYQKGPLSISQISKKLFITRPFATKIVFQLKNSNIVQTVQGKQGGVYLNHPPQALSLFTILEGMGHVETVSECIQRDNFCPLPAPCKIHSFFINQENFLLDQLKSKTIAELAFDDADFDPKKTKIK
jgi:Rrf2 family protein